MTRAEQPRYRRVEVRTPSRAYGVLIGAGLLGHVGNLTCQLLPSAPRRCYVLMDLGLCNHMDWLNRLRAGLRDAGIESVVNKQPADEARKDYQHAFRAVRHAADLPLERGEPLIALGGGVTGDVGGFAAAIYRRGIPWVNCPTTLLAMVDASVGGKTGINIALGDRPGDLKKNMAGAFHQPILVVADVETLSTLPDRELRCGLAECVKHGLIAADFGDPGLLGWTEANVPRFLARDAEALTELIARNVTIKAAVVGGDEREEAEEGGRALLNLGHTFGHAIETLPGLSPDSDPSHAPLKHGEAVALGLVAACRTAEGLGLCPARFGDRIRAILTRAGLPTAVAGLPDDLLPLLAHDKKVRAGKLRLVLPVSEGRCRVVEGPQEAAVRAGLTAIRA